MTACGIQQIHERRVINRSDLGQEIQRASALLEGHFVEKYGFGFQDGGCLMFACAAARWVKVKSGNQNEAVSLWGLHVNGCPSATHVVAKLGDHFIDSDGLATESDLFEKLSSLELVSGQITMRPLTKKSMADLPYNESAMECITSGMQEVICLPPEDISSGIHPACRAPSRTNFP